jgi:hypothetical protein
MPEVSTNTWADSPGGVTVGSGGSADAGKLRITASNTAPKTREILTILNQDLAKIRWFFISFLLY